MSKPGATPAEQVWNQVMRPREWTERRPLWNREGRFWDSTLFILMHPVTIVGPLYREEEDDGSLPWGSDDGETDA